MKKHKTSLKIPRHQMISIRTKVLTLEVNVFPQEKFKLVFDCESKTGVPRRCIYWCMGKPSNVQIGDEVCLDGRIENNVFLVWKLLIMKRSTQNEI
ncbi:MAG: hypothetical protein SPL73_05640 [Cyanobacteriota bacterium]|nr:hypothetical protein [Cyanobacteriota bacterium]MDY6364354.1 hypothetical protein [Cyanobacteriota bacterium]